MKFTSRYTKTLVARVGSFSREKKKRKKTICVYLSFCALVPNIYRPYPTQLVSSQFIERFIESELHLLRIIPAALFA